MWLDGRQLYLGGFQNERDAAAAYDIAALACKGQAAATNFGAELCGQDLKQLEGASKVRSAERTPIGTICWQLNYAQISAFIRLEFCFFKYLI